LSVYDGWRRLAFEYRYDPQKQPFYAGTYIPRETRFGRIGMLQLIPAIQKMWATRQPEITASISNLKGLLAQIKQMEPSSQDLGEAELHQAYNELQANFDPIYGGFGQFPSSPRPTRCSFC